MFKDRTVTRDSQEASGGRADVDRVMRRAFGHRGENPARVEAAVRLESTGYKVNSQVGIVTHRCQARTCPTCGRRRGWETRQVLLERARAGLFRNPIMLTLTVDPKRFASPEEAHDAVAAGKFIPRLLRLFGIKVWVWVLEFHVSGWPHWHVLVDLSDRGPLRQADYRRLWHLWRDTWGLGRPDVRVKKDFETSSHAVNYVTKYLTKAPKGGYPSWFLAGKRRRMIQASKRVGRLCFKGFHSDGSSDVACPVRRQARTLLERMGQCRKFSHLIERSVNCETGEEHVRHLGELSVSREALTKMLDAGDVPVEFGLETIETKMDGYTKIELVMRGGNLASRVAGLQAWAAVGGRDGTPRSCCTVLSG